MSTKIFPIFSKPSVQLDGTQYATDSYTSSRWTRFQRGLPRKIGGYKQLVALDRIARGVFVQPISTDLDVYIGDSDKFQYLPLDQFGNVTGPLVDRTPVTYVPDANNQWTVDNLFVAAGLLTGTTCIFAHAAPNINDISSSIETPVFYGDINTDAPLIPTGVVTSGGMVSLAPYMVYYGKFGVVQISMPNDPTTIQTTVRVTGQDIVNGKQTRGGNSSPAGLLWSLDSVIRITQAGANSNVDFRFDTLSDETSIMASNSIIEYDSRYFWIGIDKFFIYNGVVQELPNDQSTNFFFDNVNYQYREKIWATKVPHYNEIWWFFPFGDSVECNEAIIFNVRSGTWYNTAVDRSSGYYPQVFNKPIWADSVADDDGKFPLWIHEYGVDKVVNNTVTAIDSYYETGLISFAARGPEDQWTGIDKWVNLVCMEPDFATLVGDMTFTVNGREYCQGDVQSSSPYSFNSTTTKIDMNGSGEQRRFMTLKFESNVVGGNYQAGLVLLEIGSGDVRK